MMLLNHPLITNAQQEKRESSSLNLKEFKSDVFAPCMETVAEVESSFMGGRFSSKTIPENTERCHKTETGR